MSAKHNVHIFRPRALLLVLLGLVLVMGCHRRRSAHAAPRRDPIFGTVPRARPSVAELDRELAYARALLEGTAAEPPEAAKRSVGARVFLTFFAPPRKPVVTTGLGGTVAESIAAAAHDARTAEIALASARIELDLVVRAAPTSVPKAFRPGGKSLGRVGVGWVQGGRLGFVLPAEVMTRGMLGEEGSPELDDERFDFLLERRLGAPCQGCTHVRFETASAIEAAPGGRGGHALGLARGRLPRPSPDAMDVDELGRRIHLGADYLARAVGDDGRFVYEFDALAGESAGNDYSIIRHAGATDALFESYEELREPRWLDAGERALGYLHRALAPAPFREGTDPGAWYLPDEDSPFGAIGGTGLALVAFTKHAAVTRDPKYLPTMRAMGLFLVHQLSKEGHFEPYFPPSQTPEPVDDVLYYPGEAMLGLLRLHAIDRDPRWLEAAVRAARFRLGITYDSERDRHRDYWFCLSLTELYRETRDTAWLPRLSEIADGTMHEQDDDEEEMNDREESFDALLRANPTGVALEAYAAMIALRRHLGAGPLDEDALLRTSRRAASLIVREQFTEANGYFLKDPVAALGGIHGNPWGTIVRIDDNQHALMGLLGLRRVLRDPAFGKATSPLGVTPL